MKKMTYNFVTCNLKVEEYCKVYGLRGTGYTRDSAEYAVEKFFSASPAFKKRLTEMCLDVRYAEKRGGKKRPFRYIVPASFLELPGAWVSVQGMVVPDGVSVRKIELLEVHPCFNRERHHRHQVVSWHQDYSGRSGEGNVA